MKRTNGFETMRTEREIRALYDELEKLPGFIANYSDEQERKNRDLGFVCDVLDVLLWVLEEMSTEEFRSGAYLNLDKLKEIEERTWGKARGL
ncbi:MAG: hypothetical protein GTO24_24780 [candidate division Zixibacteria bacterium]|nr:hypothetical protein [candidate division Zixibacteria bacterium]